MPEWCSRVGTLGVCFRCQTWVHSRYSEWVLGMGTLGVWSRVDSDIGRCVAIVVDKLLLIRWCGLDNIKLDKIESWTDSLILKCIDLFKLLF